MRKTKLPMRQFQRHWRHHDIVNTKRHSAVARHPDKLHSPVATETCCPRQTSLFLQAPRKRDKATRDKSRG